MRKRILGGIGLALLIQMVATAQEAPMKPLRPDQVAFRALYKELVETNTTLSAGSCTLAAERLAADMHMPDDDALSVYGALLLRGATAAANAGDRSDAVQMLDEADDAARRLNRPGNARWTAFGPTYVAQHRVHVAMVLGDAGTAIDVASRIDVDAIPIAERKAGLFIDKAHAYAQWGRHEQAYQALRAAEQVAPEEMRTRVGVHNLVGELASRVPRGLRTRLYEFADSIGAMV